MDKMAKNVDLNFKVGTSTRLHCRSTDWSLVEDLTLNRGDNIEWVFLNLNQSISVQAWIAIPPKSRNIWVFKNTRLNTPSDPILGIQMKNTSTLQMRSGIKVKLITNLSLTANQIAILQKDQRYAINGMNLDSIRYE